MKFQNLFKKFGLLVLCLVSLSGVFAQRPGTNVPRQEKLLNGLKLLMWNDPAATDVKVSIRLHSGAAFDPQGKEGVMQLLADNIFPNAASKSFFAEDLDGTVEVICNYDYIQINATSKPSEFVTLLETVAQAVSNPTIDKETTSALKKSLTEKLTSLAKDPAYIADQAVAKRLFGTFPYGRPQMGSVESMERIDFADLLFAKERFLSADNATVAISGNFNGDLGFRTARRYFGAWLKSDKRVPSTFRQPDEPDTKLLEITIADADRIEARIARRSVARNDKDYFAAQILSNLVVGQLISNHLYASEKPGFGVSNESHMLPGALIIKGRAKSKFNLVWPKYFTDIFFAQTKVNLQTAFAKRSRADQWLDVDTYKLTSVADDLKALDAVTFADVQRVAERLAKNAAASVIVKPAAAAQ